MTHPALDLQRPVESLSRAELLFADCTDDDQREEVRREFLASLPPRVRHTLPYRWGFWARPNQLAPPGDEWDVWMRRAGRGEGKTRSGAEHVRREVKAGRAKRVGLVSGTAADVRDVMIEGESGLLAVHPLDWRPIYEPSKRRLTWPNGAIATGYTAEKPRQLRGPQFDLLWFDEPATYTTGEEAWDMGSLALRLGDHPRAVITGTPRPVPWLRQLEEEPRVVVTHGTTFDNLANLAEQFIARVLGKYAGTRLGLQELFAEYLDATEGALWDMPTIEAGRIPTAQLDRERLDRTLNWWLVKNGYPMVKQGPWTITLAVDPPGETAECGIVVVAAPRGARAGRDHGLVLEDASLEGPPEKWGQEVVDCAERWGIRRVVVEKNQGGDMVRSTVHNVDPTLKVEKITAQGSKEERAMPVSVLYERLWLHHVGYHAKLEDQMTTWVPKPADGKPVKSPDRIDALVHAVVDVIPDRPVAKVRTTPASKLTAPRAGAVA